MKKYQDGFTMIELVVVISILGILAAIAIPKYLDFQPSSAQAAVAGVGAAVSIASAINHMGIKAGTDGTIATVTSCVIAASLLDGGLPTGYSIAVGTGSTEPFTVDGSLQTCVITGKNSKTSTIKVYAEVP